MIIKQQIIDSLRHENAVIKHLGGKVTPEMQDWRPTPGQRSILELLQYMTCMAEVPARFNVTGSWEHGEALELAAESVTIENFPARMDAQMQRLEEILADVDEEEARTKPSAMPWGQPSTVGAGFMDMVLKCLVAYRMQLFLYLKQAGHSELGPANCWVGVDVPAP